MSHEILPRIIDYAARSSVLRLEGGQFSKRRPNDRPRVAKTSFISVNDFLPKFGVLSSSTSVR